MIQFVKPNLLGTKKEFMNRFVNPIEQGQCADAMPRDVRRMKRRAHILHNMLEGCVQVRGGIDHICFITFEMFLVISKFVLFLTVVKEFWVLRFCLFVSFFLFLLPLRIFFFFSNFILHLIEDQSDLQNVIKTLFSRGLTTQCLNLSCLRSSSMLYQYNCQTYNRNSISITWTILPKVGPRDKDQGSLWTLVLCQEFGLTLKSLSWLWEEQS